MPINHVMVSRVRQLWQSAAIGAIAVSNVLLFAPFTLYVGNRDEFTVPLSAILAEYLLPGLALVAVIALIGAASSRRAFAPFLSALAAFAVLLWLQGSILVWPYGVLDGSAIAWTEQAWRGVLDSALWLAALLAAIYLHERFGRLFVVAAVVTFGIQLALAVAALAGDTTVFSARADRTTAAEDQQAIFRFSTDDNVVQIVMDGFQSDIFEELISDPDNASLLAVLSGFTFFKDHLGVFPFTEMTLPAIVSGKTYRNHVPKDRFIAEAMRGDTILNAAYEAGYEVDIAAPASLENVYTQGSYTHSFAIANDRHVTERDYVVNNAAKLADLAIFRVVPHFAKALVYRDQLWLLQSRITGEAYLQLQYFADLAFLKQFAERMSVGRPTPVYKLLHLMLSHRPTVGNERCEFDGRRPTRRRTVMVQARCGLQHVVNILQRLRELDIYDDAVIVLMADHGAWIHAAGYVAADAGRSSDAPSALTVGMAVPLLAIKPRGASGPLAVSTAPTSVIDAPKTIANLMGIASDFGGLDAFAIEAGNSRTRSHFIYGYGRNPDHDGYLFPLSEYEVDGSPFDAGAWRLVRRHLPAGRVERIRQGGPGIAPIDAH